MNKVNDNAYLVQRIKRGDALYGGGHENGINVAGLQTELNTEKARKRVDIAVDARIQELFTEMLLTIILAVLVGTGFIVSVAAHIFRFNHVIRTFQKWYS